MELLLYPVSWDDLNEECSPHGLKDLNTWSQLVVLFAAKSILLLASVESL